MSLARKFAEREGIQEFFRVRREEKSNLSVRDWIFKGVYRVLGKILEKMTEIVLPGIRVQGKFK